MVLGQFFLIALEVGEICWLSLWWEYKYIIPIILKMSSEILAPCLLIPSIVELNWKRENTYFMSKYSPPLPTKILRVDIHIL